MKKITFGELESKMFAFNKANNYKTKGVATNKLQGVIVFKSESFTKPYSLKERSYCVTNDNKAFYPDAISSSLFGDCLDGNDIGVRLDWYMHDPDTPWLVDYCYLLDEVGDAIETN